MQRVCEAQDLDSEPRASLEGQGSSNHLDALPALAEPIFGYWQARGRSQLRGGAEIVFIQDGMDQAKFPVPRSGLLRAKRFDSMQRLKLHVGCSKHLSWIPPRFLPL